MILKRFDDPKKGKVKPQYQVIFTSTGVPLIIRASVSHRVTLPFFILNADLESLKHRHRISSFVAFILRNKKRFVNKKRKEKYFYFTRHHSAERLFLRNSHCLHLQMDCF